MAAAEKTTQKIRGGDRTWIDVQRNTTAGVAPWSEDNNDHRYFEQVFQQYRTTCTTLSSKKQESRPRLDFSFQNGGLFAKFSTPNSECLVSSKNQPAFPIACSLVRCTASFGRQCRVDSSSYILVGHINAAVEIQAVVTRPISPHDT